MKARQSSSYIIYLSNIGQILLKHPLLLEEFISTDLVVITQQEVFCKGHIFHRPYVLWSDELNKSVKVNYYQKNYIFSFEPIIDGSNVYVGEDRTDSFHLGDSGYIKNGDYLFLAFFYNFIKKIASIGGENIRLVDLMGEGETIFFENISDINTFFDGIIYTKQCINNKGELMTILNLPHDRLEGFEKGSDLIKYLEVPYKEAIKIEGFPKEWLM